MHQTLNLVLYCRIKVIFLNNSQQILLFQLLKISYTVPGYSIFESKNKEIACSYSFKRNEISTWASMREGSVIGFIF